MSHKQKHGLGDTDNHTTATTAELNALLSDGKIATSATVPESVIYVATNGDDIDGDGSMGSPFLTIVAALASITDNDINNRYAIKIAPGNYTENNPIQLKEYVNIYGEGGLSQVNISAQNSASNIFTAAPNCAIYSITHRNTSAYAINVGVSGLLLIKDCSFIDCAYGLKINNIDAIVDSYNVSAFNTTSTMIKLIEVTSGKLFLNGVSIIDSSTVTTGIHASGVDSLVSINNYTTNTNNLTTGLLIDNGADVTLYGAQITGDLGNRIDTAIKVLDDGSHLDIFGCYIQHANYGISANNNSLIHSTSLIVSKCDYGLFFGVTDAPIFHLNGGSVMESITWDIFTTNSNAVIRIAGASIDENKLNFGGADIAISHISSNVGDEGLGIKGELHVGSPERGAETVLGEGDSYTRGLIAYTYDGTSYANITAEVVSGSGSTFTFPNTSIDTAIYLSSDLSVVSLNDYHKFFGIKMKLLTSQSGGSIVGEYYNGTSWVEFTHMTKESGGSYHSKSNQLFNAPANSYQVRFNPFMKEDWTKNNDPAIDATDRYWIRFRITASPTTLPVFEQIKLHSNRTEINADGYLEHMGSARSYREIAVNWNVFKDAGTTLENQDLYISDNCSTGLTNNKLSQGDTIGVITSLSSWIDTSAPLKVQVAFMATTSGSATITTYLNSSNEGDTVYTSAPGNTIGEISVSQTKTLVAGEQIWFDMDLDISHLGARVDNDHPDSLWINTKATSLPGTVNGMQYAISLLQCVHGSHV